MNNLPNELKYEIIKYLPKEQQLKLYKKLNLIVPKAFYKNMYDNICSKNLDTINIFLKRYGDVLYCDGDDCGCRDYNESYVNKPFDENNYRLYNQTSDEVIIESNILYYKSEQHNISNTYLIDDTCIECDAAAEFFYRERQRERCYRDDYIPLCFRCYREHYIF